MKQKRLLYLLVILLFASCATRKDLAYFQDILTTDSTVSQVALIPIVDPTIQIGDQLLITITALDPEGAAPFNLQYIMKSKKDTEIQDWPTMQYYQVDTKGNIDFPMLGTLQVAGMKKSELHLLLATRLESLLKDPVITIRFVNYRITVLGAVSKPGVYTPQGERITLLEALGLAGDVTVHAKTDDVLVIREDNGKVDIIRVNLQSSDLFASPSYYLQQNDVIYVAPRGAQLRK